MKGLLLITLLSFTLASCFKTDNRNLGVYNVADGYIRYQLNNFPFEINGGYSSFSNTGIGVYGRKQLKTTTGENTRYVIVGQLSARRSITIVIATDSLTTGTYTTSSSSNPITTTKFDSVQYSVNRSEDVLNLDIIRNTNGTIDGTFSGKLSNATTDTGTTMYAPGLISNGVFKNIAISYQ
ncbi:hypothetical protein [Segetibacter aerophilus]|uniref:Lipoprotein n=1 Tax=Segetibacter aerophilus TaxID=670293 RepID=A0A512BDC8_9BACT|nr:hypothetical protein [Segetibacter aerophilus]GEO09960.1 hypothetical protein SAE01_24560 [Segetibacter aerophilus]